jgi:hypothetical protein
MASPNSQPPAASLEATCAQSLEFENLVRSWQRRAAESSDATREVGIIEMATKLVCRL